MRSLMLLAMVAGCEGVGVEGLDWQAPPPSPLVLSTTPMVPGQPFTMTVSGASSGQRIYLAWSTTLGPGPCLPALNDICLDIVSPNVLATITANPSGVGTYSGTLPATFALSSVALQSGISNGANSKKSNSLLVPIGSATAPAACHTWDFTGSRTNPDQAFVPFRTGNPATSWAVESMNMRQVTLTGTGDVTLSGSGITAWTTAGVAVSLPRTVTAGQFPYTVLIHGSTPGQGAITATPTSPTCGPARVKLDIGHVEIAGNSLTGAPWFRHDRGFWTTEDVEMAIDPRRNGDRVGRAFTAYVVDHKTEAQWAADSSLTPVVPTVSGTVAPGFTVDNIRMLVSSAIAVPRFSRDLDVVIDFDGNGVRSRGDLVHGDDRRPGFTVINNPEGNGPYGTRQVDWTAGGSYSSQRVYAPTTLPPDNMPLIIISHGNGHDYRWYDYLGQQLSSWGYVVMSHSSNTGPGPISAADTLQSNINSFYTNLPNFFSGALVGRLTGKQSWIGHSRGGEAVAIAYDNMIDGRFSSPHFTYQDVLTISSIAPTVFQGMSRADPHSVTYHLIAGGADGDVTGGVDCAVCQYYRIPAYGLGRTLVTYVQGASHNDFHSGGGWNDATGPFLIGGAEARRTSKVAFLSLFEWHHRQKNVMEEVWTRGNDGWRPPTVATTVLSSRSFIPGPNEDAQWVDDFQTNTATNLSSSGGAVTFSVANVSENTMNDPNTNLTWATTDPMNGMTQVESDGFERGMVFDWVGHSYIEWALPAGFRNQSSRDLLMMRVAQGTRHPNTELLDTFLSFGVTLRDGAGRSVTVRPGFYQGVEDPYERTGLGTGAGWSNEFDTVTVRLSDFLRDGTELNLSDLRAVRIETGPFYGAQQGRIGIDDLLFAHEGYQL